MSAWRPLEGVEPHTHHTPLPSPALPTAQTGLFLLQLEPAVATNDPSPPMYLIASCCCCCCCCCFKLQKDKAEPTAPCKRGHYCVGGAHSHLTGFCTAGYYCTQGASTPMQSSLRATADTAAWPGPLVLPARHPHEGAADRRKQDLLLL